MGQVVVKQLEGDRLESFIHSRDLLKDVDAVLVLIDHALKATHLTLDAPKSPLDCRFVVAIARFQADLPGSS
jgi:hypothetical protein